MILYLGTHMPSWLGRADVPLCVSHRRLVGRRTLPVARTTWALDSGGFTELSMFGEWRATPTDYVAAIRRYRDEIGGLQWAAPMDWMCEPPILAKTGLTVAVHQERTLDSILTLRALAADLPIIPVLQGWTQDDYRRHADAYQRAGIDLAAEPLVGLGSVCRRQATAEIAQIVGSFEGIRLHGFGVKSSGFARYGWLLDSADSLAWSARGRRIRPCPHTGAASCANCHPHALAWRARALQFLDAPVQLSMTEVVA